VHTVALAELFNDASVTRARVRDIWAQKEVGVASGSLSTDRFGGHDSRFYVVEPLAAAAAPPAAPLAAAEAAAEAAAGDDGAGGCEQQCLHGVPGGLALGHCCTGLFSASNQPSCAMGCLIARHTTSLHACEEECRKAAAAECTYTSAATGNQTLDMCSNCFDEGQGGDNCGSLFGTNDSTCTVQLYEGWQKNRGCDTSDCLQACSIAHGCE
jgi:hypothetical protein